MVAEVDFGAHLPLIDFGTPASLPGLKAYAHNAAGLGYRYLCANDHLLFARPWLDGPIALAAVIEESQDMTLATTVSLPVLRGPAQLAKTLAAIDILWTVGWSSAWARDRRPATCGGRHFVDERWPRFAEAIPMLRALLAGDQALRPSTRLMGSSSSRGRRSGRHRRSGSRPGAHRPASGGSRGPATAGSRPPTTPLPNGSAKGAHAWRRRWSRSVARAGSKCCRDGVALRHRRHPQRGAHARRCPRPAAQPAGGGATFALAGSVPPKCAPSESQRSPPPARSGCLSGPCATG